MAGNFNKWPFGKKPSSNPEKFKEVLIQYIAENPNKSQNSIARTLGISQDTIGKCIKKWKISYTAKPRGWQKKS